MQKTVKINAADSKQKDFSHFWNSSGFSPASLVLQPDMRQQLQFAGSIPHKGIRYMRIHYLLDLVTAQGEDFENLVYDWRVLDTCIDTLHRCNILPLFELMGNPSKVFTDFSQDIQANAWRKFVSELAHRYIEKYGKETLCEWLFETWNEPDQWWTQDEKAFLMYYDACSEALKDVDPDLQFGGPGTCRGLSPLLKCFLEHCDNGENYYTGKKDVRVDFISIHAKGVFVCPEDVSPSSRGIYEKENEILTYMKANHPRLLSVPFTNNECDPQTGWWDIHTWRAKSYYAAFVTKIIVQHYEEFIQKGINYMLLSSDNGFAGTWGQRTLCTRFGLPPDSKAQQEHMTKKNDLVEDISRREFALIKKPVLNLMSLLSFLGNKMCAVEGVPDSLDSEWGIVATSRDNLQVAILVYTSKDKILSSGTEQITCNLNNIPFDKGILSEYRIEDDFTDPFSVWENMEFPKCPNSEQLLKLREASELHGTHSEKDISFENGSYTLNIEIPTPSARIYLFSKDPCINPQQPQKLSIEVYKGLDPSCEDVMILWSCLDSYYIKTYEVFYKPDGENSFLRINSSDTICGAWVYSRPKNTKGTYAVKAVDYWNRTGELSEEIFG